MPATARSLGADPDDAEANISAGARYLRLPNPEAQVRRYRALFVATQFLDGVAWGGGALLFLTAPDADAHGFALVMLILVCGMIATTASAIPAAVGAGLAPIVAAAIWAVGGRSFVQLGLLFTLGGGMLIYFVVLANRLLRLALAGLSTLKLR